MNHCTFTGNISRINELKETTNGKKYLKFTLAVDRRMEKGQTDFVSMTAFDKRAEFISKYCKKGTKALSECHYQQGSYTGKDGKTVYTSDFIVDNFEKLSKDYSGDVIVTETTNPRDEYGFMSVEADGLEDEGLPFN